MSVEWCMTKISCALEQFAYHATSRSNLEGILKEGLRPGSYWATRPEIREYYAETIAGEGEVPVIIRVQVADLEGYGPQPDRPGLQEPISSVIGMNEDQVWTQWEQSGKSWRDCDALIGSFYLKEAIPVEVLIRHNPSLFGYSHSSRKPGF